MNHVQRMIESVANGKQTAEEAVVEVKVGDPNIHEAVAQFWDYIMDISKVEEAWHGLVEEFIPSDTPQDDEWYGAFDEAEMDVLEALARHLSSGYPPQATRGK